MSGSKVLATARLLIYFLFTCAAIPVQLAAIVSRSRLAEIVPVHYHRACCRIMGLDISASGTPSVSRPTLFICNHSSYLDILVLGALIPGYFVTKSEVANWPFFGVLAKLQRTVFVDRRARNAGAHQDRLRQRLEAGDNLILFPEGTSSDGNRTLPFKSALFAAAGLSVGGRPVRVQPVSITCTALDGLPLGRRFRPVYAWYGDMDLAPHLWNMAGLGRLKVAVAFHPPTTLKDAGSRKMLAARCWGVVSAAVVDANAGRRPRDETAGEISDETATGATVVAAGQVIAGADLNP